MVVTTTSVWVVDASLNFESRTDIANLILEPGRKATSVMAFANPVASGVLLAIGDDGGGISVAFLSDCSQPWMLEVAQSSKVGSSAFSIAERAPGRGLTADALFVSASHIIFMGFVQGTTGLQLGVKGVFFPSPRFSAPIGVTQTGKGNSGLLILEDTDASSYVGNTSCQALKDEQGKEAGSFVAISDFEWYSYATLLSGFASDFWQLAVLGLERHSSSGGNEVCLLGLFSDGADASCYDSSIPDPIPFLVHHEFGAGGLTSFVWAAQVRGYQGAATPMVELSSMQVASKDGESNMRPLLMWRGSISSIGIWSAPVSRVNVFNAPGTTVLAALLQSQTNRTGIVQVDISDDGQPLSPSARTLSLSNSCSLLSVSDGCVCNAVLIDGEANLTISTQCSKPITCSIDKKK